MALVPLGCGATITNRAASEGPRVPDATAERLRECVDEFGGDLHRGSYTFDAAVKVDEDGHVVDVKGEGVPHEELAICMRIALRGMTVPEGLVRLRELRLPESPETTNGQTAAERGLVGHPAALVAVAVALAELVIEVGPTVIAIAAAVEISGEIAEVARKPKPNKNRCLDAAAGGGALWENFCDSIPKHKNRERGECWGRLNESEQNKRGWCNEKFGKW